MHINQVAPFKNDWGIPSLPSALYIYVSLAPLSRENIIIRWLTSGLSDLWKGGQTFCSPFIDKCANLLRTLSLISFAKVSIGGIRFSKASCFEWSDTRKYFLLPRRQFYLHVYVNRDQFLNGTRSTSLPSHNVEIILCCQHQHCFPARLCQRLWCFSHFII